MEESGSNHKEGWLYKRHSTFVAHKWKKLWFRLKDTKLYYGESEQVHKYTAYTYNDIYYPTCVLPV